jgi:hypothetical protein
MKELYAMMTDPAVGGITPRWFELSDDDRDIVNHAINAIASGGSIARVGDAYAIFGYRD